MDATKPSYSEAASSASRKGSISWLRACADRSWLSRRSAFPTVAAPCFPDQSPDCDDHLRERHPEVDHPPHPLRAPEELLVGVVPRARPLHHPPLRRPKRRGLALPRDLPPQPQLPQTLAGEMRVVATVELDVRPLGQRP